VTHDFYLSVILHPNHHLNNLRPNHDTVPHVPIAEHQPLPLGDLSGLIHLPHGLIHDFLLIN